MFVLRYFVLLLHTPVLSLSFSVLLFWVFGEKLWFFCQKGLNSRSFVLFMMSARSHCCCCCCPSRCSLHKCLIIRTHQQRKRETEKERGRRVREKEQDRQHGKGELTWITRWQASLLRPVRPSPYSHLLSFAQLVLSRFVLAFKIFCEIIMKMRKGI